MTTTEGERIIPHCLVPATAKVRFTCSCNMQKKRFDDDNGERVREGGQGRKKVTIDLLYGT
jgi:hypothetical protein